jgi:hypothetical protein
LGIETCFATRVLAHLGESPSGTLADLKTMSLAADTLDLWLDLHEYLIATARKFRTDAAALRRLAADVVGVFEPGKPNPFIEWYCSVSARVRCLRCVFEESEANTRIVRDLLLLNLDTQILGPHYQDGSLVLEPDRNHFELLHPDLIEAYLSRIVAALDAPAATL